LASLGFITLAACLAPTDSSDGKASRASAEPDEQEPEPETQTLDEELATGDVSCRERTETAYVNGNPKRISVITIAGKAVTKPTGHAFLKMQKAAKSAGIPLTLRSGFRTQSEQQYLYGCYQSGRCNNGNLAARPGYSNHQSGIALDLSTSDWLARNARNFGFVRTVPSEDWHYEYQGSKDPGGPCSRDNLNSDALTWESPKDGGWYKNGIWMKVRTKLKNIAGVRYLAGNYSLGVSTHETEGFPVHYTFKQIGERSITAEAYDFDGKKVAESTIDVTIKP